MEGLEYESHYGDMRTDLQEVWSRGLIASISVTVCTQPKIL